MERPLPPPYNCVMETKILLPLFLFVLGVLGLGACAEIDRAYDPYYGSPSVYEPYRYGSYDDHYHRKSPAYYDRRYYENQRLRREQEARWRAEQELAAERNRLARERVAADHRARAQLRRPSQDRCPAGFSPSERKCTQAERRRGCRDIRLPSGLGCVSR